MPAYPQRTDLAVTTPASKTYGAAADSRRRQQAVPMGTGTPPPAVAPVLQPVRPPQPIIPLDAPTRNPNEPITAGANFGPGMNAVGAGLPTMKPATDKMDLIDQIKYIYSKHPNTALYQLLMELEGLA